MMKNEELSLFPVLLWISTKIIDELRPKELKNNYKNMEKK
jgi:hypothetical protein